MDSSQTKKDDMLKELYKQIPFKEEEEIILLQQIIELKQWSTKYPEDKILKENIILLQNYMNT